MFFTDQLNNSIELLAFPKRIVSLVPSQTELLWDLGIRDELIGVTKFCIHPKELHQTKTFIGGTKTLHIQKIKDLKPHLIIGNKEENEQSQILELQKNYPVWISDINTLSDALSMIKTVGEMVDRTEQANAILTNIQQSFQQLNQCHQSVLYLIWNNPYMAAGNATFIGHLLERMGLFNCIKNKDARYPTLTIHEIIQLNPDIIFLSSEPYPFKNTHIKDIKKHLPQTTILLVDGELFSWYGSRLLKSVEYFNKMISELS